MDNGKVKKGNENNRWIQRLSNFKKAFKQLELGVEQATDNNISDLEKEGLIQRFEYTQELSWLSVKNFYESIGETNIQGSKDAFQLAIKRKLIDENCGAVLMRSIRSRNDTVHTYNKEIVDKIFHEITEEYYQAFLSLKSALEEQQQQRE